MEPIKSIYDIVDIEYLQKMQDDFSKAVGMAFVVVDYKGNPVTEQSGFTEFCKRCRKIPKLRDLCYQCDAHGGLHATITGKPHIYICHAGLIDFAVPFIYNGNYYGAFLAGQISTSCEKIKNKSKLGKIIDRQSKIENFPELLEYYSEIKSMQFEKIEAVVSLVFEQANNLLSKGHINAINKELKQKNIEILEEKSKRIELEKILRKNKELTSSIALKSEYLFSSLSVISRLAYIENAKKTENSIYILSDMLRYTSDRRYSQISTLGEEIKYIDNYLKLQSIRLEERLKFNIDVSEEFFNIACPYMILQPIVENSIEYAVEPKKDGGEINISCNQKENDLIISIFDNGCGVSKETIENIMNENSMMKSELDRYDLYNINKCMIGLFGKKYGLIIENVSGNGTGTVVKLKLPIKSNIVK